VVLLVLLIVLVVSSTLAERKARRHESAAAFVDRGFWFLWQGGGPFQGGTGAGVTFTAILADALRIAFVYILHKRYFG
jgi:hypothetical protein